MQPKILLLVAVLLPPFALNELGAVVEERVVRTPFGDVGPLALRHTPADSETGEEELALWVEPYSGSPSRTDPRATLHAAASLGLQRILTWDTAIALSPTLQRGEVAIPTDMIDFTRHQPDSFLTSPWLTLPTRVEEPVAGPFCPDCLALLHESFPAADPVVAIATDGPRRETPAEGRMFRNAGGDVICANLAPEAFLARELQICFSGLVTIGDYSTDQERHPVEGEVRHGLENAMSKLPDLLRRMDALAHCSCTQ